MKGNRIMGVLGTVAGMLFLPLEGIALQISIESKELEPGEPASLQVVVSQATELGNLAFDLGYDGMELELREVSVGQILEGGLCAMNPETFPSRSGVFRFNGVLAQGFTGEGEVLRLTFSLSDTAQGEFPVTFKMLHAGIFIWRM